MAEQDPQEIKISDLSEEIHSVNVKVTIMLALTVLSWAVGILGVILPFAFFKLF